MFRNRRLENCRLAIADYAISKLVLFLYMVHLSKNDAASIFKKAETKNILWFQKVSGDSWLILIISSGNNCHQPEHKALQIFRIKNEFWLSIFNFNLFLNFSLRQFFCIYEKFIFIGRSGAWCWKQENSRTDQDSLNVIKKLISRHAFYLFSYLFTHFWLGKSQDSSRVKSY